MSNLLTVERSLSLAHQVEVGVSRYFLNKSILREEANEELLTFLPEIETSCHNTRGTLQGEIGWPVNFIVILQAPFSQFPEKISVAPVTSVILFLIFLIHYLVSRR